MNQSDIGGLGITNFNIKKAYLETDIVWNSLQKPRAMAIFKRIVFFIALVLFSFLFLTPSYAASLLDPLRASLEKDLNNETLSGYVQQYFATIVTLIINFGLIPLCIDISSEFEDYRRQSAKQVSIMDRIYFFMLVNTLLIPITASSTAMLYFKKFSDNITHWPNMISTNLMSQQYFYIKFII